MADVQAPFLPPSMPPFPRAAPKTGTVCEGCGAAALCAACAALPYREWMHRAVCPALRTALNRSTSGSRSSSDSRGHSAASGRKGSPEHAHTHAHAHGHGSCAPHTHAHPSEGPCCGSAAAATGSTGPGRSHASSIHVRFLLKVMAIAAGERAGVVRPAPSLPHFVALAWRGVPACAAVVASSNLERCACGVRTAVRARLRPH